MGTLTSLIEGRLVAFDSAPLIYYLEEHPRYTLLSDELFDAFREQRARGLTSFLTLLEVLVLPLRAGHSSLASHYRQILGQTKGIALFSIDRAVCERAAQLRADHHWLRTPDALQVATAIEHGAQVIVTNDNRWKRLREISVAVFDDYVGAAP